MHVAYEGQLGMLPVAIYCRNNRVSVKGQRVVREVGIRRQGRQGVRGY